MKFSTGVVAAIAPMAALAFIQPTALRHTTRGGVSEKSFGVNPSLNTEQSHRQNKAMNELKMAFKLEDGETSNMFDGGLIGYTD